MVKDQITYDPALPGKNPLQYRLQRLNKSCAFEMATS